MVSAKAADCAVGIDEMLEYRENVNLLNDRDVFNQFHFVYRKLQEGFSEDEIDDFFLNGLSSKKFRKYLLKKIYAETDFMPKSSLVDFDFLFEKYLDFKNGNKK